MPFIPIKPLDDIGMNGPRGILIFGPNGSGKTTLGRELARVLGFWHMDIEDYHFLPSKIPYTAARSREECLRLLLSDMEKHRTFVLSAVTGEFGDIIPQFYELAVFLSAPKELRMARIEQRAQDQHGPRVRLGGDMYEQHTQFADFAANRDLSKIEQYAETLHCPVVRIDGAVDWRQNAKALADQFKESAHTPQHPI